MIPKISARPLSFSVNQGKAPRMIVSSVDVSADDGVSMRVGAMWDTGADFCSISSRLAQILRLKPFGTASRLTTSSSASLGNTYMVSLTFENGVVFDSLPVIEDPYLADVGVDFLIGMAVINAFDFSLSLDSEVNTILTVAYSPRPGTP